MENQDRRHPPTGRPSPRRKECAGRSSPQRGAAALPGRPPPHLVDQVLVLVNVRGGADEQDGKHADVQQHLADEAVLLVQQAHTCDGKGGAGQRVEEECAQSRGRQCRQSWPRAEVVSMTRAGSRTAAG